MKYIYLFLILFFNFNLYAQGTAYTILEENNAAAWLTNVGILFNNPSQQIHGYDIGNGQSQHLLYSSSFWFGGLDSNQDIFMCGQRYLSDGTDQTAGPYSSTFQYNSPVYQQKYMSSIWVAEADSIDYHINHFNDQGYSMPYSIENWPAHGDTTVGVAYDLAPYVDVNGNQKYDPENGDYPEIKGCRAIYIITNDHAGPHDATGGMKMGIEMHYMIYQRSKESNLPLTTFIDLKVYNRSETKIKDFTIGLFADGDLGNPYDDYAGCDTLRNLMYYYNGDNLDEDFQGTAGFDLNPPAFGIICLNDTMNSFGQFKNGGTYEQADPNYYEQYWNIMNARWNNGVPWTDHNNNVTNFLFHDAPTQQGGYSAYAMQIPPTDIRTIMSVKASDLDANSSVTRTYAVIPAFGSDHIDAVDQLFSRVDQLQADYLNGLLNDCDLALGLEESTISETIDLYPNPNNGSFYISGPENTYSVIIRNTTGQLIYSNNEQFSASLIELPQGIESGIYSVMIQDQSNQIVSKKIIVH
tara:strand:+ start:44318 stop:45889 length:1572 start_codon:yes stop_codon:yes gene_type:complete